MNGALLVTLGVAALVILWLWSRTATLTEQAKTAQAEVVRLSGRIQHEAMAQFQKWRSNEYDAVKRQEAEVADRAAQVKLAEWKASSEAGIRADAIQRSRSVIVGKVSEHIVPHLPEFTYNPKDARFIGSPVDFIVFDGLDVGDVRQVVFIEVKTGSGTLTKRERQVRDALVAKRVMWHEMRVDAQHATAATASADSAPAGDALISDDVSIVSCARCGTQNRINFADVGRQMVRCGRCKAELLVSGTAPD